MPVVLMLLGYGYDSTDKHQRKRARMMFYTLTVEIFAFSPLLEPSWQVLLLRVISLLKLKPYYLKWTTLKSSTRFTLIL